MTTETPAADAERERLIAFFSSGNGPPYWKETAAMLRADVEEIMGMHQEIADVAFLGATQIRSMTATIATLTQDNERLRDGLNRLLLYIDSMEAKQSTKNDNAMFIDTRAFCGLKCEVVTVRNNLELAAPEAAPKQSAEGSK